MHLKMKALKLTTGHIHNENYEHAIVLGTKKVGNPLC